MPFDNTGSPYVATDDTPAPFAETLHIHATHVRVFGNAPQGVHARDGEWRLTLGAEVIVNAATDPIREAAEALRERGVQADTHVSLYAPSHNVAWSGPLKNMSA